MDRDDRDLAVPAVIVAAARAEREAAVHATEHVAEAVAGARRGRDAAHRSVLRREVEEDLLRHDAFGEHHHRKVRARGHDERRRRSTVGALHRGAGFGQLDRETRRARVADVEAEVAPEERARGLWRQRCARCEHGCERCGRSPESPRARRHEQLFERQCASGLCGIGDEALDHRRRLVAQRGLVASLQRGLQLYRGDEPFVQLRERALQHHGGVVGRELARGRIPQEPIAREAERRQREQRVEHADRRRQAQHVVERERAEHDEERQQERRRETVHDVALAHARELFAEQRVDRTRERVAQRGVDRLRGELARWASGVGHVQRWKMGRY